MKSAEKSDELNKFKNLLRKRFKTYIYVKIIIFFNQSKFKKSNIILIFENIYLFVTQQFFRIYSIAYKITCRRKSFKNVFNFIKISTGCK